jgi:branched-chain amino acid transport system substrate-binding protein
MRSGTNPDRATTRIAVCAILVACGGADGEVVLGVSNSTAYMDGARLAFADAAAEGQMVGVDTVMVPERTNEAAPAIRTAQRFVAHQLMVGVVGHSNSSASLAAAGIYNQRQVVQLAPTSSAVVYSEAGPYSFRLVPPDDRQARFLVEQVAMAVPAGGRIALFYVNDDYGRGLRNAVRAGLAAGATNVVLELPHVEGDLLGEDIAQAEAALRAADPDLILWLGRGSTLDHYLTALRSASPDAIILGGDAVAGGPELGREGGPPGRWDGVRHVDFLELGSTPALRDFAARYRARFGRAATVPDALTYDAVRVLLAGIAEGARTGPALQGYLMSLGGTRPAYPGITGPIVFDEQGNIDRTYVLVGEP